jgi:2-polyprenyl-3-methyl-5-hydroxy-6-metoxy-1,4-benzoquinol methylase
MSIKVSRGLEEDGIVVGNTFDKYGSTNPIVKKIMQGFESSLSGLVDRADAKTIHEVGCGEGHWCLTWLREGRHARGSDFSRQVIELAKQNAASAGLPGDVFEQKSIYDLTPESDKSDLVVCCEVFEHLEHPEAGLDVLHMITAQHLIISVPREPVWCALNLARGHYLSTWGNTPGHIQHWSAKGFQKFVSRRFDIIEIRKPLPWTMLFCKPK